MKEKLFDLNSRREATVAVVTLGDKTFRIARVVIAARVMYSNYLSTLASLLHDAQELNKGAMSAEELEEKYRDKVSNACSTLQEIVALILKSNGYEYDAAWWDNNSDIEDLRNFIDSCMSKDNREVKDKKKE